MIILSIIWLYQLLEMGMGVEVYNLKDWFCRWYDLPSIYWSISLIFRSLESFFVGKVFLWLSGITVGKYYIVTKLIVLKKKFLSRNWWKIIFSDSNQTYRVSLKTRFQESFSFDLWNRGCQIYPRLLWLTFFFLH